jgi:arabinose-5-phosphate isomerase
MNIVETGRKVLEIEADAIQRAISRLDNNFETAVDILFNTHGRIVITGMGKSGIVGKKISATLTSTGTPSVFLHPSEALHGDIGIINQNDTVLALSTSGETQEVIRLINLVKRIGVKLVSLVGAPDSTLAQESDVSVDCSIEKEACPIGLVPTASTTLTLAIGDAISIALMEKKGFKEEDYHYFHPGGAIGKKLLKVKHLMHRGDELPVVAGTDPMPRVLDVINKKHFGVAVVVDGSREIMGIITDGDLRRQLLQGCDFSRSSAVQLMTADPLCIGEENLAVEALKILEENRITSLIVKDEKNHLLGLLHLHDLWRTEMF